MLTVYGIETTFHRLDRMLYQGVATVLTVYGIETVLLCRIQKSPILVATVLTVYGIETREKIYLHTSLRSYRCNSTYRLRY